MTETEVRHWLKRAFYAEKRIRVLDSLIQQCRERSQGLSRCGERNDKGKSSTALNGTENALMKLADMELEAAALRAEAAEVSSQVWRAIRSLNDIDLETVLIHRYILFHTIEETAELLHYHPNTVKAKTAKAIEKLCPKMSCNVQSI